MLCQSVQIKHTRSLCLGRIPPMQAHSPMERILEHFLFVRIINIVSIFVGNQQFALKWRCTPPVSFDWHSQLVVGSFHCSVSLDQSVSRLDPGTGLVHRDECVFGIANGADKWQYNHAPIIV